MNLIALEKKMNPFNWMKSAPLYFYTFIYEQKWEKKYL